MEGLQGEVVVQHYVILYRKPTEVKPLYPIAHIAVEPGTDLSVWLGKPPKANGYPRYAAVWKRLGAPVKKVSYCAIDKDDPSGFSVIQTPLDPIVYLQPQLTKAEVKTKERGATGRLAKYFVCHHLKRAWTKADYGGMHMAHAKRILGLGYSADDAIECLQRLARGDLTDGVPWVDYTEYHNFDKPGWSTLLCVLWGEPPAIEREILPHAPTETTPEAFIEWREKRKAQGIILDETPEETALRDFSKAPEWAEKDT